MPAAFKATYSDFKLIRTRSVVQIVLEVPLEGSAQVLEVLDGMPNPANEIWLAVARLGADTSSTTSTGGKETTSDAPPPPASTQPQAGADKRLAKEAGRLCNDPKFHTFLRETMPGMWAKSLGYEGPQPTKRSAGIVREYCEIMSRSEILPGTVAGQRWNLLASAYKAWDKAPSCGVEI